MNWKGVWLVSASLYLGGCATGEEAVLISNQYAGTPVVSYADSTGLWRIADIPQQERMRIGPSLSRTLGASFGADVTFVPPTGGETAVSAQGYLASVGRSCVVTEGTPLLSQQWELRYSCR